MIFIISGPGGVGKGTVVARLMELDPRLRLSRSWTTRARRPGEPEDAYVFVDEATFRARLENDGFLEWNQLPTNGHLYGTPSLPEGDPGTGDTAAGDSGDVVLEIELNGASQIKERYPSSVLVFVLPPSQESLEARLRGRGDDDESVRRRLKLGAEEMEIGARMADHVVVNDDVERAAREVADIIERRRGTSGRTR